jgi:hypothetical protein
MLAMFAEILDTPFAVQQLDCKARAKRDDANRASSVLTHGLVDVIEYAPAFASISNTQIKTEDERTNPDHLCGHSHGRCRQKPALRRLVAHN